MHTKAFHLCQAVTRCPEAETTVFHWQLSLSLRVSLPPFSCSSLSLRCSHNWQHVVHRFSQVKRKESKVRGCWLDSISTTTVAVASAATTKHCSFCNHCAQQHNALCCCVGCLRRRQEEQRNRKKRTEKAAVVSSSSKEALFSTLFSLNTFSTGDVCAPLQAVSLSTEEASSRRRRRKWKPWCIRLSSTTFA